MKEAKVCIIATIVTVLLIVSCAYAMPAHAEARPEYYPKLAAVVSTELGCVNCLDREGNVWSFYTDDDTWAEGDIVNLLMHTVDDIEEDDQITEVYWIGYVEDIGDYFDMMGWH